MRAASSIFKYREPDNESECRICRHGFHTPGECNNCNCGEDEVVRFDRKYFANISMDEAASFAFD
jgi:hypothetical protein